MNDKAHAEIICAELTAWLMSNGESPFQPVVGRIAIMTEVLPAKQRKPTLTLAIYQLKRKFPHPSDQEVIDSFVPALLELGNNISSVIGSNPELL